MLSSGVHYDVQHQSLFIGELLQEAKAVFHELQRFDQSLYLQYTIPEIIRVFRE